MLKKKKTLLQKDNTVKANQNEQKVTAGVSIV